MAKFKLSLVTLSLLLMYLSTRLKLCRANLNVYLNVVEVRRLLGTNAELFYVRDGVLNDYALNFVVPVPAHLHSLHFSWQSLAGRPLPYSIGFSVSDPDALDAPTLNISQSGNVPTQVQTFAVGLPCTGVVAAEVDLVITINVTLNRASRNFTLLHLRRNKICLRGPPKQVGMLSGAEVVVGPTETMPSTGLYIAISCASVLVTLFVITLLACYLRPNKGRRHGDMLQESRNGSNCSGQGLAPAPVVMSGTLSSHRPSYTPLDHCDRSNDLEYRIGQLTIQRRRVRLRNVLLEGTFGRVYRGTYTEENGGEEDVFVKTVTDHASSMQESLLLQEGMVMYGLSHKNILPVLGVSIEDHTAPYVIYPHKGFTNLKRFLQKCKLSPEGVARTLTTQELVDMAIQIITGLMYLHKKRLLHKDLATRNCVVDNQLNVQITDNALSRDLFPADYHCLGDNENRPVKWMSIECLTQRTFSVASDVWAFGVLLWELTTLAQQPYVEIDPFEIAAYLRDGYRLAQPINCPDELFAVMAYCWAMSPNERPNFQQLLGCLQEFYAQLTRYV